MSPAGNNARLVNGLKRMLLAELEGTARLDIVNDLVSAIVGLNETPLEDGDVITSQDELGREILTVGQLRRMLAGLPDDTHVVSESDDFYQNIRAVGVPRGEDWDGEWSCLTFLRGAEFDFRQL